MTSKKIQFVIGVAVAAIAGCSGGQAESAAVQTPAPQSAAPQATAPANGADADAATASAATSAMSGALKGAIAMHAQAGVPALACGVETEASLEASQAEVRKLASAEGIGDATFDQVYAAAERKSRARWDSAPAATRAGACEEWKTMTEQAQAWTESQGG